MLARVQLEDEVTLAFNPEGHPSLGLEWDDRQMAEAVVRLLESVGARM